MKGLQYLATVAMACSAAVVIGQSRSQIAVLGMPSGQVLKTQLAEGLLSVHYDGAVESNRRIYVRVFRDTLDDLVNTYPRLTPKGKCVVYAHAVRFSVDHGF